METVSLLPPFGADAPPLPVLRKVRFLSFIVPTTSDGEETLQAFYAGVREQAEQVAEDWEIVFVDHGGEERTHAVVEELCAKDPAHVLPLHLECRGRSDALAAGYRKARGVFVFTLESDQDHDLKEISPFMERIHNAGSTSGENGIDRWQKILPRGVLRRVCKSRRATSKRRFSILPV